jgi:DNA modification methylase
MGWEPTCTCNADVVPATVLDPFAGSGTTMAVAQKFGRKSVGTDLSREYLDLATKRLGSIPFPLLL